MFVFRSCFGLLALTMSSLAWAGKLVILRFDKPDMKLIMEVITRDLAKHEVKEIIVSKDMSFDDIYSKVVKEKPELIVGLDNFAVNHIKTMQTIDGELKAVPGAATMALNLHHVLSSAPNMCGIAFEVPAFSIVTKFRLMTGLDIKKVLTFYRKTEFETSYSAAVSQLKAVGIELIGIDVDSIAKDIDALNAKLSSSLSETYNGQKIDAVLIPADNIILNRDSFSTVWLPKAKSLNIPFLCNIEKFTAPDFDFCSFAAYPDIQDLGRQFAEQLGEVLNSRTPPKELGVDFIVATKEKANVDKLKKLDIIVK